MDHKKKDACGVQLVVAPPLRIDVVKILASIEYLESYRRQNLNPYEIKPSYTAMINFGTTDRPMTLTAQFFLDDFDHNFCIESIAYSSPVRQDKTVLSQDEKTWLKYVEKYRKFSKGDFCSMSNDDLEIFQKETLQNWQLSQSSRFYSAWSKLIV